MMNLQDIDAKRIDMEMEQYQTGRSDHQSNQNKSCCLHRYRKYKSSSYTPLLAQSYENFWQPAIRRGWWTTRERDIEEVEDRMEDGDQMR